MVSLYCTIMGWKRKEYCTILTPATVLRFEKDGVNNNPEMTSQDKQIRDNIKIYYISSRFQFLKSEIIVNYLSKKSIFECEEALSLSAKDGCVFVGLTCSTVSMEADAECPLPDGAVPGPLLLVTAPIPRRSN